MDAVWIFLAFRDKIISLMGKPAFRGRRRRAQKPARPAAFLLMGLLAAAAAGCSHTPELSPSEEFRASRREVWETLVAIFKDYPVKAMDERKGYIETERLHGKNFWTAPHQDKMRTGGLSSVLKVNIEYRRPYTKVYVLKQTHRRGTILSSPEDIPSDFFEEHVFLYRLGRELLIRKAIQLRSR